MTSKPPRVREHPGGTAHSHDCKEETVDTKSVADSRHPTTAERLTREARGIQLFEERGEDIQQLGRGVYSVPSCSGRDEYLVRYSDSAESCECKDFEFGHVCKHLYATALFSAKRRRAVRTRFAPVLGDEE
jgi:hypothetical protein